MASRGLHYKELSYYHLFVFFRMLRDMELKNVADHLLSVVTNQDGTMISVHADLRGLDFLIHSLSLLRQLAAEGRCEDLHLFSDSALGGELSTTKLVTEAETTIVEHVKVYAWTDEWAIQHKLLPTTIVESIGEFLDPLAHRRKDEIG